MTIRQQINYDLFESMKSRNQEVTAILRTLLSEIANAEAVETDTDFVPMDGRTADVPRKTLTEADIRQILQTEADNHRAAIVEFEENGRHDAAQKLHLGLTIIERYLS
jgi:uncharacterized protein YqeY